MKIDRLGLSAFFYCVLFAGHARAFVALIDFEIVRYRILDRERAAGGSRCDSDDWGPRYNPCDFVFYVKNCTQVPASAGTSSGSEQCTTRIDRFYAKENSDDVTFYDGTRPITSFVVDNFVRDTYIRIEVNDQDDKYSNDDPIGIYQLKVVPDAIDPRGQQFVPGTDQIIQIPDHSEMIVRYRASCLDEECRVRRPGFDQRPGFGRQPVLNDQPAAEGWSISKNGKDPSRWTGSMRPPGSQLQQALPFGQQQPPFVGVPNRAGANPNGAIYPEALQGRFPGGGPVVPGGAGAHGFVQRPPFVEWPRGVEGGGAPLGERSAFPPPAAAAALGGHVGGLPPGAENSIIGNNRVVPENPFAPSHPGLPAAVASALSSSSFGNGIDQIERQIQASSDQDLRQLQSQASRNLGFHCENGRCQSDSGGGGGVPFQAQQHEQTQIGGNRGALPERGHQEDSEHERRPAAAGGPQPLFPGQGFPQGSPDPRQFPFSGQQGDHGSQQLPPLPSQQEPHDPRQGQPSDHGQPEFPTQGHPQPGFPPPQVPPPATQDHNQQPLQPHPSLQEEHPFQSQWQRQPEQQPPQQFKAEITQSQVGPERAQVQSQNHVEPSSRVGLKLKEAPGNPHMFTENPTVIVHVMDGNSTDTIEGTATPPSSPHPQ